MVGGVVLLNPSWADDLEGAICLKISHLDKPKKQITW
jgi:hypothetical protein